MEKKKTVVTSALPYANGPIHLGHMVEYIQTDIYVRVMKMTGEDVIYCCADDTHGTPIEINAKQQGIPPEELIGKYFKEHVRDFRDFEVNFDNFYSTNSSENKEFSDLIFSRLMDNGDIYTKEVELTYCEQCQRFLPDRYVKGNCPKCGTEDQYGDNCESCNATYSPTDLIDPHCVVCGSKPGRKNSKHYFFRLNNYSDKLRNWLIQNKMLQNEIRNYILNWIDEGLRDWDISRDAPYFGFPILGEKDKYYYVWLDAPIGYISSTKNYCTRTGDKWEDYWVNQNGRIIHFIGKDIIYFHFLFWPAMLIGAGFNLPENLVVHGFLTINKEKMSKSRGTYITARQYLDSLDPAYLRYYYASNLSNKMSDIDLDLEDFRRKVNSELIGNFANIANRSLTFLERNFRSRTCGFSEPELEKNVLEKAQNVIENYKKVDFRSAIREILEIGDIGNRYFQEKEPWSLLKENPSKAHEVVSFTVNIVRIMGILFRPVLPRLCTRLERQLGIPHQKFSDIAFDLKGHTIGKVEKLIQKIESVELIKKDPFASVDLRVGKVLEASSHPSADKLVVMRVDLGNEKRQILAGIRAFYSDLELTGKNIIVVANLKTAKLRGLESQGMLLAATGSENLGVLTVDAEPGTPVRAEGIEYDGTEMIEIADFKKFNLHASGGNAFYDNKVLKAGEIPLEIDRDVEGKIS